MPQLAPPPCFARPPSPSLVDGEDALGVALKQYRSPKNLDKMEQIMYNMPHDAEPHALPRHAAHA